MVVVLGESVRREGEIEDPAQGRVRKGFSPLTVDTRPRRSENPFLTLPCASNFTNFCICGTRGQNVLRPFSYIFAGPAGPGF